MSKSFKHGFFIGCIGLLTFIACWKLYAPSFYTSHDGEGHVIRMIEYDEAWREGQIPIRITKRINYGLGYPFFNFNYPLPYFFGELVHLIGFSFVASFKILFIISTFIGGLSMYVFMLSHVTPLASFISALFYIMVPYRFLNMYVRGNPAESLAWSLFPLILVSIDRLVMSKGKKFQLFVIAGSLFTLAHNGTVVMGIPVILSYFFIQWYVLSHQKHILNRFIFALILIACMTSFFWLPVIVEMGSTKLAELSEDYPFFFPTLKEVLYSPWGFGAYKQGNVPGKMSPQIGLLHIGVYILSIIIFGFYFTTQGIKLKRNWRPLFFILVVLISLLLMLPISKPLWDTMPLLQTVQLPWRFLGLITLGCAVLAGFVASVIPFPGFIKILGCVLCVILLLYSNRNHIRVNLYTEFQNPFERNPIYGFSTTSKDEHMPRAAPRIHEDPNPDGDIFPTGAGSSTRTLWKSNDQEFIIKAYIPLEFRANVSYFPGWTAYLDGKYVPILYSKDEYQRLRIAIPAGIHTAAFRFGEPWYRMFADIISVGTFMYICLILMQKKGENI